MSLWRLLLAVGLCCGVLLAQVRKQHLNPKGLAEPRGYTHVVTVEGGGKMIFISGQVAYNANREVVGKGDLRAQTTQAYENLKIALTAAGATFADVVKMNTYVVNYKSDSLPILREAREKFLGTKHPPASTLIGVQALASDDFLIEIEAVAVVP